jgi:hypothetical protein
MRECEVCQRLPSFVSARILRACPNAAWGQKSTGPRPRGCGGKQSWQTHSDARRDEKSSKSSRRDGPTTMGCFVGTRAVVSMLVRDSDQYCTAAAHKARLVSLAPRNAWLPAIWKGAQYVHRRRFGRYCFDRASHPVRDWAPLESGDTSALT